MYCDMSSKINNINGEISKIINRLGLNEKFQLYVLQCSWTNVVGKFLAAHSMPQRLSGGYLTIHTDNAGIGTEIHYLQDKVREKIYLQSDIKVLTKILTRVGTLKPIIEKLDDFDDNTGIVIDDEKIELTDDDLVFVAMFSRQFDNTAIYEYARRISLIYAKRRRKQLLSGWIKCNFCNVLYEKNTICSFCAAQERVAMRMKFRAIMNENPLLDFEKMRNKLIISKKYYDSEKKLMISDLLDKKRNFKENERLLMLRDKIAKEDITPKMISNVEKEGCKKYI